LLILLSISTSQCLFHYSPIQQLNIIIVKTFVHITSKNKNIFFIDFISRVFNYQLLSVNFLSRFLCSMLAKQFALLGLMEQPVPLAAFGKL